jgi:hypothetical protein
VAGHVHLDDRVFDFDLPAVSGEPCCPEIGLIAKKPGFFLHAVLCLLPGVELRFCICFFW